MGVEHACLSDESQLLIVLDRLFKVPRCIARSERLSCRRYPLRSVIDEVFVR